MTDTHATAPVAYLTGEYPAVSHTFILREVEALRALGRTVLTCSVRRTGPEHLRGPAERQAAETTFHVLEAAKRPATLLAAIGGALSQPGRLLSTLALAWRTCPPGWKATLWQAFYLVEALVLARHLKATGAVRLHNHFAMASSSVAMLTSSLTGIPYSFTLHGPADFLETTRWRLDVKIARADLVACISQFCRSQGMLFSDPAHWSKMRIVHCGVELDRYGPGDGPRDSARLLFVGRLAAVKGVRVLLDALAKLHANHPDATLTLVGDGPEREAIEVHAQELGLGEAVRFAGYLGQDEVAAELGRADLFVLPSFAEGVPVVLMEAMASRLPVVATRIAGIPELVEDGVSGRLVTPGDADALAGAVSELLSDPEGRTRMGAAGRETVAAAFDVAREAARLDRLFVEAAS
ncbi:MAG: glycosyltransferase family 4 protein [Pseudomonadota bacterium]